MTEPDSITIQDKYSERIADDLENNRREQNGLLAELADLQQRLDQLRADEVWLADAQRRLTGNRPASLTATTASRREQPVASAAADIEQTAAPEVPAPRRTRKASAGTGKARGAGTDSKSRPRGKAKQRAAPATAKVQQREPTLRQLIQDHLAQHGQPRAVREIVAELSQHNPSLTSIPVVRQTCEALVAQHRLERTKQGRAVYYIAPAPASPQAEADSSHPVTAPA